MAVNETIVTGRKFRKCIDAATKAWQRISFWTKSSDVEFEDGKNAETKLGAIDGITDSLENTSSRMAASAKAVSTLNNNLGGYSFGETADGKPGYRKPGADTVIPFSNGFKYIEAYYIIGNYYNSNYNYDLGRVIYDPTGIGDQKLLSGNGYYSSGWHTNISVSSKASGYQGLKGHTTSNSAITIAWIQ